MKKIFRGIISSALFCFCLTSCEQVLSFLEGSELDKPTFDFKDVSLKALDSEGLTLKCEYDITNPYSINLNVSEVNVSVDCDSNKFTDIKASEGISMAANSKKTNTFDCKIPYASLLNFAKSYGNATDKLPFNFSGNIGLSNELLPGLSIPFKKSINAPVVKPSFSASSPTLVWPSKTEILANASSKLNGSDYLSFATSLAGGSINTSVLKKLDLNLKLNFNLNVANNGGSAWKYLLKSCAINTTGAVDTNPDAFVKIDTSSVSEISNSSGSIPLTAVLNTVTAGDFIASIVKGTGSNPKFNLGSGVKFPGLGETLGKLEIPLNYEMELPLSSITNGGIN